MVGNPVLRLAAMVCGVWVFLGPAWASAGQIVTLPLQTRDEKNQPHIAEVRVDAARIGVVVMDMWDKHWGSFGDAPGGGPGATHEPVLA